MKDATDYLPRMCNVTGCETPPAFRAEIVIFANVAKLHPPAIGFLPLCVCAAHADEAHAHALLSDAGKRQIEAGFRHSGYALPDWKRSFVRWKAL